MSYERDIIIGVSYIVEHCLTARASRRFDDFERL